MSRGPIEKDWRDKLKPGEILINPNGTERVVRRVTFKKTGFAWAVYFVRMKCCNLGREQPHVFYFRSDIVRWTRTGASIDLNKPIDRQIEAEMNRYYAAFEKHQWDYVSKLTCCEVKGLIR